MAGVSRADGHEIKMNEKIKGTTNNKFISIYI